MSQKRNPWKIFTAFATLVTAVVAAVFSSSSSKAIAAQNQLLSNQTMEERIAKLREQLQQKTEPISEKYNAASAPESLETEEDERLYLEPFKLSNQQLIVSGVSLNSPNLETVTFDSSRQRYIGLHLDSWDLMPLHKRHQSTNRICINLGLEDRFFLFINLTLMDIFHALNHADNGIFQRRNLWAHLRCKFRNSFAYENKDLARLSPPILIQEFMKRFPFYPVIKVRIAPGEAYIAPTENMIHDGCSLGKQYADLNLTFRGYIGLPRPFEKVMVLT
jgi:hypothetical protein